MVWVVYNKIPIYPIFYLLKGDYSQMPAEGGHASHRKGTASGSQCPAHGTCPGGALPQGSSVVPFWLVFFCLRVYHITNYPNRHYIRKIE